MHYQRWRQHGDVQHIKADPPSGCRKCGAKKHRDARGKLYCKPCAAALGVQYRQRNAEKLRLQKQARHAQDRERRLPQFRAHYQANRDARNEQTRQWQKDHPDLVRRYKQKWASGNPEKAREYGGRRRALYLAATCEHGPGCVSAEVYRTVQASRCLYCGRPAEHADHYIPLTRGGLHCADNIVPACQLCNLSKNNRMPDEWLASVMPT